MRRLGTHTPAGLMTGHSSGCTYPLKYVYSVWTFMFHTSSTCILSFKQRLQTNSINVDRRFVIMRMGGANIDPYKGIKKLRRSFTLSLSSERTYIPSFEVQLTWDNYKHLSYHNYTISISIYRDKAWERTFEIIWKTVEHSCVIHYLTPLLKLSELKRRLKRHMNI